MFYSHYIIETYTVDEKPYIAYSVIIGGWSICLVALASYKLYLFWIAEHRITLPMMLLVLEFAADAGNVNGFVKECS